MVLLLVEVNDESVNVLGSIVSLFQLAVLCVFGEKDCLHEDSKGFVG